MADVQRVVEIRNTKPALAQLLQRGSIGDDLWQRFLRAEQEMEEELRDVISEVYMLIKVLGGNANKWGEKQANEFHENWGTFIFQSGNEMSQNFAIRKKVEELQNEVESEKAWWVQRRTSIQEEFMKELDGEAAPGTAVAKPPNTTRISDDEGVLVEAGGPSIADGGKKKKKGKK
jgi:translocation protein SEC66